MMQHTLQYCNLHNEVEIKQHFGSNLTVQKCSQKIAEDDGIFHFVLHDTGKSEQNFFFNFDYSFLIVACIRILPSKQTFM
jgi:hypothetical protein